MRLSNATMKSLLAALSVVALVDAFSVTPGLIPNGRHGLPPGLSQYTLKQHHRSSTIRSTAMFAIRRGGGKRGPPTKREPAPPMNMEIAATQLRVITPNPDGKDIALGVMSRDEALAKAKEMGGLDVIMINDKSDPPVVKITDYSKFRYMLEKKAKEVKKNSKASELKEVKMSYKIDVHDYDVRKKNAFKFLEKGDRVKCTVMFRGREMQHDKLGYELLDKLAADLEDVCLKEGRPKREGRNLSLILGPRAEVLKALSDKRRALEKAKKLKKAEELEGKKTKKGVTADGTISFSEHDEDDEEEEDDDDDISLDDLFGSDDFTENLFNPN